MSNTATPDSTLIPADQDAPAITTQPSSAPTPNAVIAVPEGRPPEVQRAVDRLARIAGEALPPELAYLAQGAFGAALEQAVDYAKRSVSPRTEKSYQDYWTAFQTWCVGHGAPYLPAPPAVVAAYLAHRATTLGRSGLRVLLAAIAFHHRRAGHLWTPGDPVIATVMRGILRAQRRPVRPAAAITSDEIRRLLSVCDTEAEGAAGLAAMRDRALLLTCFAGGLRRSELVALDHEHLRFTDDGLVLRIVHSKRDQEGEGADVGLSRGMALKTCPVRSMEAWLRRAGIQYGPVFPRLTSGGRIEGRLTGHGVWQILRRRAAEAGLTVDEGERLSPHGLRAGFITEAYLNGALDEQVMAHARQKAISTTRRYRQRAKTVAASPTKLLNL